MKKIPENISIIIKAIAPLIGIVVLFLILGNIGYTKIRQIQSQIALAKQDKLIYTDKLQVLRTVAVTGTEDSDSSLNGLPSESPALAVVSQLKNLAAGNGLILSTIKAKVDSSGTEDIKSVAVDFNIVGGKDPVQTFLLGISLFAPITTLNKVKITEQNGIYTGEISVNSYWSALPTQLPATIEEFADLTESDKRILSGVNALNQPVFINLPPSENGGKADPFSE